MIIHSIFIFFSFYFSDLSLDFHKFNPTFQTPWIVSENTAKPSKNIPYLKPNEQNSTSNIPQPIDLKTLEHFAQEQTPLKIHNKALSFLKSNQKELGFLLLKRNIYQNFFLPSYFVLSHSELSVSWTPFLWHIGLMLLAGIALLFLFSLLKNPQSLFQLHLFLIYLSLSFSWFFAEHLLLKKRVSSFQKIDLRLVPFSESSVQTQIEPSTDLIVIKQQDDWLLLKSLNQQTGWVKKQQVFQIF